MAVDATGTPSTNFSFPKYNVNVDAPSGLGLNNIIDDIDSKLKDRFVQSSGAEVTDGGAFWNGSAWVFGKVATANITDDNVTPAKLSHGTARQILSMSATDPQWESGGYHLYSFVTHAGGNATQTFSSIPADFKHLHLVMLLRNEQVIRVSGFNIRFNNDSGVSYDTWTTQSIRDGTVTSAGTSGTAMTGACSGGSLGAPAFSYSDMFIPYYSTLSYYRQARITSRVPYTSGTSGTDLMFRDQEAAWINTAVVNRIDILGSGNWSANCQFALYGIG